MSREKHELDGCCNHKHSCGCHEHERGGSCGCHDDEHGSSCSCHEEEHGCACGCGHDHDHGSEGALKEELPRLLVSLALFAAGMLLPLPPAGKAIVMLACYAAAGYDVLISACRSLLRGRMLDENFLMAIASLAAIAIGEMTEGCAVMLFYQVGECCQAYAVGRSRSRIKALLSLKADEVSVLREGKYVSIDPAQVAVGEEIRILPGERVPLDALVLTGMSEMDTSALTGESVPRTAEPGEHILAGFISKNGVLTARVEKPLAESSVSRILAMVEQAQERKAGTERFITVFARVYTPIVVGLAAALAIVPPLIVGDWRAWIYRALTFLVASCPCALVISLPLCYFAGIGSAARRGVLIKGGDSLDALCRVKTFVMDKTGTLTTGAFNVCHVHPAVGCTREGVLALIAGAELGSSHPLAAAAVKEAAAQGIVPEALALEEEIAGRGVRARSADGCAVLAGSAVLMEENGVALDDLVCGHDSARIYVSRDGHAVGMICMEDMIKPGAKQALSQLRRMGVARMVMLTGDRKAPAMAVAAELGMDDVHAQLLPGDKLEKLEAICSNGACAFVGDGINDAPALVRADVGIAMGALGSDAAIEAADVVLMTDEMDRLPQALYAARRVRMLARQNVIIALGVKIAVLGLAALGMAGMWAAVFADVGVALLCVLNAMRAMR